METNMNLKALRLLPVLLVLVAFALPACSSDNSSAPASASAQEAQVMYETFSILGMMMAQVQNEVAAKPSPESEQKMREAGRAYLQSLFKDDVDKVVINEKGLSIQ